MINSREKKKKCVSVHDLIGKKKKATFTFPNHCCAHINSHKGSLGIIDRRGKTCKKNAVVATTRS